jgi:hypothetical protein
LPKRIGANLFLYSLMPTFFAEMASLVEDNGHAIPLGEAALIGTGIGLAAKTGKRIAESIIRNSATVGIDLR